MGVCANKKGLTKNKTPYLRACSFLGGQFLCKLKPQDGCFMEIWEPKVGAEGVPNFSKAPLHGLLHGLKIRCYLFFSFFL